MAYADPNLAAVATAARPNANYRTDGGYLGLKSWPGATIGEVIQRPDFEYHDDDTYRGYASAMRDAAIQARDAAAKNDYDAARTAVGALKKSCDSCHGDYRG